MTEAVPPVPGLIFDHLGIVVPDLARGVAQLCAMLGPCAATARFDDPGLTVSVRFLRDRAGMVYELIAPLGPGSVVEATVQRKHDLLNQIAYRTADLDAAARGLRAQGCFVLGPARPAVAFAGARVQFLFTPLGFVLELIETTGHQHRFEPLEN